MQRLTTIVGLLKQAGGRTVWVSPWYKNLLRYFEPNTSDPSTTGPRTTVFTAPQNDYGGEIQYLFETCDKVLGRGGGGGGGRRRGGGGILVVAGEIRPLSPVSLPWFFSRNCNVVVASCNTVGFVKFVSRSFPETHDITNTILFVQRSWDFQLPCYTVQHLGWIVMALVYFVSRWQNVSLS